MTTENLVPAIAGSFILISVVLAHYVSPYWLLLTLFVGVNLLQSGFTGFCPLSRILQMFGVKQGHPFSR